LFAELHDAIEPADRVFAQRSLGITADAFGLVDDFAASTAAAASAIRMRWRIGQHARLSLGQVPWNRLPKSRSGGFGLSGRGIAGGGRTDNDTLPSPIT